MFICIPHVVKNIPCGIAYVAVWGSDYNSKQALIPVNSYMSVWAVYDLNRIGVNVRHNCCEIGGLTIPNNYHNLVVSLQCIPRTILNTKVCGNNTNWDRCFFYTQCPELRGLS